MSSDLKCCRATASAFSAAKASRLAPRLHIEFCADAPNQKADCRSAPLLRRCQTAAAGPGA